MRSIWCVALLKWVINGHTGVSILLNELGGKRLELLRELVPAATSVGFLANPTRPSFQSEVKSAQQAAQALGVKLIVLNAGTETEIDTRHSPTFLGNRSRHSWSGRIRFSKVAATRSSRWQIVCGLRRCSVSANS